MINIVLVTHGDLGEALIRAAEMIVGPQESVQAVSLLPEDSPEFLGDKLDAAMAGLEGQDALILVDLFGGTPFNVSSRKVLLPNVECVTGLNLAVLIEALSSRESLPLHELAVQVLEAGVKSVVNVKPLLGRDAEPCP
ncbi:MAG: PTS system mannose-specific EIIAB component [Chloroflexi bacterium ADurb.Bin180]|nr:MAG: PTS system mannose-specific EIIAB component [Chloroflexi bacterium ADurb.Bin180]HNT05361.1 PTS sugar transporter subunit IIA [Anaerolineae bacterium]